MRFLFPLVLLLTACNYELSSKDRPPEIELIEATSKTVAVYNAQAYEPLKLPKAYQTLASAKLPPRAKSNPTAIEAKLPPRNQGTDYLIGNSDIITLASPNFPTELVQEGILDAKARRQIYQVRGDGTIAVPGLAPIPIAGLTLAAAEEAVFDALITQNLEPNLSLEVTEYKSQTASISGSVATPILANISNKPLYLDQALQMAGGVTTQNPDQTIIRIFRDGETYQLSARDAQSGQRGRIALHNADRVVVEPLLPEVDPIRAAAFSEEVAKFDVRNQQLATARRNFDTALALGAVKRQAVYLMGEGYLPQKLVLPFESKANLADALTQMETDDPPRHVYILRTTDYGPKAIYFDLREASILFLTTRMELRPNDVVYLADEKLRNGLGLARLFKKVPEK